MKNIINTILTKWEMNITFQEITDRWNESHRHYHTMEHLNQILNDIFDIDVLTQEETEILVMSALFHDIIYNPKSRDNESSSSVFFQFACKMSKMGEKEKIVRDIILMTKEHNPKTKLEKIFCDLDLKILSYDLPHLLKYEEQVFKEFEFVNWKTYKSKRIKLIKSFIDSDFIVNKVGLTHLINIIENKTPNIAIYAGSFNPIHLGHTDIINKGEMIFDKVIIAKGRNDSKNIDEELFTKEFNKLVELYPTKEIVEYSGLLTDLLKEQEGNITLIRGIRNGNDLEAENTLITYMKDLFPELKVVYLPCNKEFEHISSSAIRSLRKHGDDLVKKYLP